MDQGKETPQQTHRGLFMRTGPVGIKITAPSACNQFMTEYVRGAERIQILTPNSNPDLPETLRLDTGMVEEMHGETAEHAGKGARG